MVLNTHVKSLSTAHQVKCAKPRRSVNSLHQECWPHASRLHQILTNAAGVKIVSCLEERTPFAWSLEASEPVSTLTNVGSSALSGRSAIHATDAFLLTLAAPTVAARRGSCASTILQLPPLTLASRQLLGRRQKSGTSAAPTRIVIIRRNPFAKIQRKEERV